MEGDFGMLCHILPPYEFKRMGQSGTFTLGDPSKSLGILGGGWGGQPGSGHPSVDPPQK